MIFTAPKAFIACGTPPKIMYMKAAAYFDNNGTTISKYVTGGEYGVCCINVITSNTYYGS